MIFRVCVLVILLQTGIAIAQHEIMVWAMDSGSHKLYHCPKSKWYGMGTGQTMNECEAIRKGYRPAFGDGCGSQCK
jgi:hypothetical protein